MASIQSGVIKPKTMNIQVLPRDHKKLRALAYRNNTSIKAIVTQAIEAYKELQASRKVS